MVDESGLKKAKRPRSVPGVTGRYWLSCGHLYVTVGMGEDNRPIELFARMGRSGGCASCQGEAITRAVSIALRYGIPPEELIDQLRDLKCPGGTTEADSCPDAISKALAKSMGFDEAEKETK